MTTFHILEYINGYLEFNYSNRAFAFAIRSIIPGAHRVFFFFCIKLYIICSTDLLYWRGDPGPSLLPLLKHFSGSFLVKCLIWVYCGGPAELIMALEWSALGTYQTGMMTIPLSNYLSAKKIYWAPTNMPDTMLCVGNTQALPEKLCTWIWKTDNKQELGYILYELWKMYAQGAECTDKGYLNQNRELGAGGCI